jgi:hypothetical protein
VLARRGLDVVETEYGKPLGDGLYELSRLEVLGSAAGRHEFVEHAVECTESDRKMTLSVFEMRRSIGEL